MFVLHSIGLCFMHLFAPVKLVFEVASVDVLTGICTSDGRSDVASWLSEVT
jgi:hypothetical protein